VQYHGADKPIKAVRPAGGSELFLATNLVIGSVGFSCGRLAASD